MAEPGRIGIRAYSRHRGCTHHAVQKAISGGRLTEHSERNAGGSFVRNEKGHAQIDPKAADLEWRANTDETQQRENHRTAEPKGEKTAAAATPAGGATLFPDAAGAGGPAETTTPPGEQLRRAPTLASAQAVRTTYLAQIAKLEYEERLGALVRADGVRVEAFRVARQVRDKLLGMPDRIAAELATMHDTHEVRERLGRELRETLEVLGGSLGA